jgi:2,3-dihydroxybenzoate---[aryl-carrier protein] ligase
MLEGCTPWPKELAERYRRDGCWQDRTLGELARAWAAANPDKVAVVGGGQRVTYAEVDQLSDRLAYRLLELGITASQRVVVQLPNLPAFVPVCVALFRIGAVPVFALPAHREHEIRHFCELAEAVAYVVPARLGDFEFLGLARELLDSVPSLRHALIAGTGDAGEPFISLDGLLNDPVDDDVRAVADARRPDPADVAFLLVSGGTTGLPKLIPRTHNDYAYGVRLSAEIAAFGPDEVYLVSLPAAHNFPLGHPGLLGAMQVGGTVVMSPNPDPKEVFPLIERERVTSTALVPALLLRWMDSPERERWDLSSLRLLQVGGQRLQPEVARRALSTFGCQIQEAFGMAEGLCNFTRLDDPLDLIVDTQGRPMSPADELLIVDPQGQPVEEGEPGELLTRGPYTIRGYYRAPEHNAKTFTEDGFYRTGDVVRMHPSGNLTVEGRVKDMINRGGENISAEEIENLLAAHPNVQNVAVVAMPDPRLGERVCAYVIPGASEPPTLEDLRAFLGDRIARFKWPERVEVVDAFPTTSVGKVDKSRLREDIGAKLETEHAIT